jgi:hypothetical protein
MLSEYFDIVEYDSTAKYNADNTLLMINQFNMDPWYIPLLESGIKTVIDVNWEHNNFHKKQYAPEVIAQCLILRTPYFFWYNEYSWNQKFGYNQYQPDQLLTHLALMPINLVKPWRTQVVQQLDPYLDQFIWSYVGSGRRLPDDLPEGEYFHRYFNPLWYNSTQFTLAVETQIDAGDYNDINSVFITEKTFKPIAHQHPFLIVGQPGILTELKQLGFETFDTLFDESYDTISDFDCRLMAVVENVKNFQSKQFDSETQARVQHNHNLFYNKQVVTNRVYSELILPLLNYVN